MPEVSESLGKAPQLPSNKVLIDFLAVYGWCRAKCENDTVGTMSGNFCHQNSVFTPACNCFAHSLVCAQNHFFIQLP